MKLTTWKWNKVIVSKYLYSSFLYISLLIYSVLFLPPLDQFEFFPFHFFFLHDAFFWGITSFIINYSIHQLLIAYLSYDCPDFLVLKVMYVRTQDFPRWLSDKKSACLCRRPKRCRFKIWSRKIPSRRKWQLIRYSGMKNSWAEEPGRLQSIGSQRVRHGLATKQQT